MNKMIILYIGLVVKMVIYMDFQQFIKIKHILYTKYQLINNQLFLYIKKVNI